MEEEIKETANIIIFDNIISMDLLAQLEDVLLEESLKILRFNTKAKYG